MPYPDLIIPLLGLISMYAIHASENLVDKGLHKIIKKIFPDSPIEDKILSQTEYNQIADAIRNLEDSGYDEIEEELAERIYDYFLENNSGAKPEDTKLIIQRILKFGPDGQSKEEAKQEFITDFENFLDKTGFRADEQTKRKFAEIAFNVLYTRIIEFLDKSISEGNLSSLDDKNTLRHKDNKEEHQKTRDLIEQGFKQVKEPEISEEKLSEEIKDQIDFVKQLPDLERHFSDYTELTAVKNISGKKPLNLICKTITGSNNEYKSTGIFELMQEENHLLLKGGAGTGKTTTLHWLTIKSANEYEEKSSGVVPVYINLSDCSSKNNFEQNILKLCKLSKAALLKLIEEKRLLFLFDGLDIIQCDIEDFIQFILSIDGCRYIISSRPNFTPRLESSVKLGTASLEPLADTEIRNFIERYIPGDEYAQLREEIYSKIEDTNLQDLCTNPLLLWIVIVILAESASDVTGLNTRSGIYKKFISNLLEHAKSSNHLKYGDLNEHSLLSFLADLSFYLQCENKVKTDYSFTDFIRPKDDVQKGCLDLGLLADNNAEISIGFHQSFQEYFAAEKLRSFFRRKKDISPAYSHPKWEDVVVMTSELVDDPDRFVDSVKENNIHLAARCTKRASESKREELLEILLENIKTTSFEKVKLDNYSGITFLAENGSEKALDALIEALENEDISTKIIIINNLGSLNVKYPEIVTDLLIKNLDNKEYLIREKAVINLGRIDSYKAVNALIESIVKKKLISADTIGYSLRRIDSEKITDKLNNIIQKNKTNPQIIQRVAITLAYIGSEKAVNSLIRLLNNENYNIKEEAAFSLGHIGSEKATDSLIEALKCKNPSLKLRIIFALANIGSEKAVDPLLDILETGNSYFKSSAAFALGCIGSEKAVEALIKVLQYPDYDTKKEIVFALRNIGSEKAINALKKALNDKNQESRLLAAFQLIDICPNKAQDILFSSLKNENPNIRIEIVSTLRTIKSKKAVDTLIDLLNDTNIDVKKEAIFSLGFVGLDKAYDVIINLLADNEFTLRGEAALALGIIGSKKAIPALINALEDKIPYVTINAINALEKICTQKHTDLIRPLINSDDPEIKSGAYSILKRLEREQKEKEKILTELYPDL